MAAAEIPEPFAWNESFDIKVPVLNEQHSTLFDMIRELDGNKDDAGKLTALLEFAQLHFKTEEDLFALHNWGEGQATAHKAIHDKFVADAVDATKGGVDDGVIAFCKRWLVDHILISDVKYSACLEGKA